MMSFKNKSDNCANTITTFGFGTGNCVSTMSTFEFKTSNCVSTIITFEFRTNNCVSTMNTFRFSNLIMRKSPRKFKKNHEKFLGNDLYFRG